MLAVSWEPGYHTSVLLYVASPCGLDFSQHDSCVWRGNILRWSVPRNQEEAAWHFMTSLQKAHSVTPATFY